MVSWYTRAIISLLAACALLGPVRQAMAAEVFINVERRKGGEIRIALPDFSFRKTVEGQMPENGLGVLASEVLAADLNFSGYFDVIDSNIAMGDVVAKETGTGETDWEGWKNLAVDALVKGEYYFTKSGELAVEGRLYDVQRKEQIYGIRYTGEPDVMRKMMHRFADQIIYRFTGEKGICETRIAYLKKIDGNKELMLMDYDGENPIQLTNEKSLVLSPAWSPEGDKIMFTTYRFKNPDLHGIDLIKGTRFILSTKIGINAAAEVSPDGNLIAFTMSRHGNSDIYTVNADGKNLKRLTLTRSIETSPSFSPDGKQIVYVSDFPGSPQLYIMDFDGQNKRRFTFTGSYNADPAWSPKGDMIAYASLLDNSFNLMVKKVFGRFENQLTIYAGSNESPTWSPDGRNIAFTSTRTGTKHIYIMNANGENQTRITHGRGGGYSPAWSPRGVEK